MNGYEKELAELDAMAAVYTHLSACIAIQQEGDRLIDESLTKAAMVQGSVNEETLLGICKGEIRSILTLVKSKLEAL